MGRMARQKKQKSRKNDLGIKKFILNNKVIQEMRGEHPLLLAFIMFLSTALVVGLLTLLYLIIFRLPTLAIILLCLGLIFVGFYFLAKKYSTHNPDEEERYY